ncbi:MAG TPA: glutamate-cysteine ligase family protein, partial [Thermoanaerobaculia bacterium]|nr:glutamate-cysteine ligase family protein [Thermoanaerobaculia bacterium]
AAFRRVRGRPTSDVEVGRAGFSNELAAHVFEIKNPAPLESLVEAEAALVDGVRFFDDLLAREWGARLLPTGMHPLMDPAREGELWRRSGRRIYETYDRVFGVRGHGWLNLQSCHVNLPFGETEAETVRLHDAIALLLPYLPALAASSPLVEGALGPAVDNRLAFYRGNQRRVPSIAGGVVPEPMVSFAHYRRHVLGRIYRDLDPIPEAAPLHHEWVNSRGAIVRFYRDSIEIRVLDTQECVAMDVANAAFVRGALRRLVARMEAGEVETPPHATLVADYEAAVADGTAARVAAPHLRRAAGVGEGGALSAGDLLAGLVEDARSALAAEERPSLDRVAARLAGGNLSERIRRRLAPVPERHRRAAIVELYRELADHLRANRPWEG